MSIAFIASATPVGNSGGVPITTGAIDTTGADFIIIFLAGAVDNVATAVVTDSKSNTWTALTDSTLGARNSCFFYCANPTVGASHTFTATLITAFITITASAFSGVKTTSPFDVENTGSANSTTVQPGSVTPSENNELVFTGYNGFVSSGPSIDSGFTLDQTFTSGSFEGLGTAYLIQTTATAENPTWTNSGGGIGTANIATFKAAGGGTIDETIALGLTLDEAFVDVQASSGSIALGITAGTALTAGGDANASISLGVGLHTGIVGNAQFLEAVTLGVILGSTSTGGFTVNEGIALGIATELADSAATGLFDVIALGLAAGIVLANNIRLGQQISLGVALHTDPHATGTIAAVSINLGVELGTELVRPPLTNLSARLIPLIRRAQLTVL